ncbi:MAG: CBS domain-containing protein [Syntrophales bacterium]|nr:CBS domain-containing protein [Syntrophales bacterium]
MEGRHESQVFLFLSQILGKKIYDPEGRKLGKISDIAVRRVEPYPVVTHVLVNAGGKRAVSLIPWQTIAEAGEKFLASSPVPFSAYEPEFAEGSFLLKGALLDKQVVDTNGAKIRRVNDLQFLKVDGLLYLVHVDVGFRGLMRRVGLEKYMDILFQWLFDYTLSGQLIPWKFVQPLSAPDLLRLNIAQSRLSQLHPADLADIIEDLDIHQRAAVFQSLDAETAAETLEETDPKIQVSLIEGMNPADASDIIEEMSLSEAADLLGDLSGEMAEGILKEMEQDIAEYVKELLTHPEEKAGGMMTTSFLQFPPATTAGEAMEIVRREAEDMDFIYYLYVVDEEEHLLGSLSLRELLVAPPGEILGNLMDTRVISVSLDEEKEEIARNFAKYGIMALPVLDETNRINGVIIFKNLLEVVAPQLGK